MAPRKARNRATQASIEGVVHEVRRLERGLRLAARRVDRETGLSAAQLFVLEHLDGSSGVSVNDLARQTFTDRSSVAAVVDRLVAGGLATRGVSARDRRRAEVRITRAGRAVLAKAPPPPTDLLLHGLSGMSRDAVTRLHRTLAALNHVLGFEEERMLFE